MNDGNDEMKFNEDISLESIDPVIHLFIVPKQEARVAVYQRDATITVVKPSGERERKRIIENQEAMVNLQAR